jgi:hypothetical protein
MRSNAWNPCVFHKNIAANSPLISAAGQSASAQSQFRWLSDDTTKVAILLDMI